MNIKPRNIISWLSIPCFVILLSACNKTDEINRPWPGRMNHNIMAEQRIERINKEKPSEVKIVMLGNSITEQGGNWNEKLKRNDVFNCGQGGYTTQQFTWLLDSCVFHPDPEYCFIAGGINDFSIGVPLERVIENYKYLITTISEQGIRVVVQSTIFQSNNSRNNPDVKALNESLKDFCRKNKIPFLDLNRKLSDRKGLKEEYTTDGTHLNEKGYEVWSEILKDWMEKEGI